jgi:hypothetical protein
LPSEILDEVKMIESNKLYLYGTFHRTMKIIITSLKE